LGMSSRTLSRKISLATRSLAQQSRSVKYTTKFALDRKAVKDHAHQTADLWRKVTLYIAVPAVILTCLNAYKLHCVHQNHVVHGPLPEEKIEFPYQNIRVKNFPWGDGDKTLFWNDKVNYHHKPGSTEE